MSRRQLLIGALVTTFMLVTACSGDGDAAPSDTSDTSPSTSVAEIPLTSTRPPVRYGEFRLQPTACGAAQPPELSPTEFPAPDDMGIAAGELPLATVTTSCGDLVIELDPAAAPETVNSFVFLAEQGYFDGTAIHRVVPGFVVQGGDPEASGRGGPGYVIPDEAPEPGFVYQPGMVAMANAGPGTSGSQFFVMLSEVQFPPEFRFNLFGRLVGGEDTLAAMTTVPLGANPGGEVSTPLETIYIETVTIER